MRHLSLSLLLPLCLAAASALATAQTPAPNPADTVQRDVNQQTRIRNGLQDGSLNTREAARLERQEAGVDRLQARALRDGQLSPAEQARLNQAQNRVSGDIYAARHNGVTGQPQSASSQRMQAAVQRNLNQEKRIENGLQSGALTHHEAARLERGQAHVAAREARAGRDGHVGPHEAQALDRAQDRQSGRIARQKHDAQRRAS